MPSPGLTFHTAKPPLPPPGDRRHPGSCVSLGADLAALVTERDIFRHSAAAHIIDDPDFSERVDALRAWRRKKSAGEGGGQSALRSVERTATQLKHLMPEAVGSDAADPETVSRLLLAAFPDRVCKRRSEGGGRFVHVQGRGVRLSKDSHLGDSPYIIAVSVDAGERAEGFVHLAAPVTEELLRSECADRIETVRSVEWDRKENRVTAAQEERYGSLLLSSRTFTPGDDEAAPILCEVIRTTPGMITLTRETRQFQGRVELLKKAFPEEPWPDLTDAELLSRPETCVYLSTYEFGYRYQRTRPVKETLFQVGDCVRLPICGVSHSREGGRKEVDIAEGPIERLRLAWHEGSQRRLVLDLRTWPFNLYDRAGAKPVSVPSLSGQVQAFTVSADGTTAVAGIGDIEGGAVVVLKLPEATESARIAVTGPALFVAASADGRWVAASGLAQSPVVHVIDIIAKKEVWRHTGTTETVAICLLI